MEFQKPISNQFENSLRKDPAYFSSQKRSKEEFAQDFLQQKEKTTNSFKDIFQKLLDESH